MYLLFTEYLHSKVTRPTFEIVTLGSKGERPERARPQSEVCLPLPQ